MQIEIASKKLFHSISEFRFLRELGVGSFGKVKLAVHKGTRKQYAIKVIGIFPTNARSHHWTQGNVVSHHLTRNQSAFSNGSSAHH